MPLIELVIMNIHGINAFDLVIIIIIVFFSINSFIYRL